MTTKVMGYAASSATVDLAPYRFERRDPRPDGLVIGMASLKA